MGAQRQDASYEKRGSSERRNKTGGEMGIRHFRFAKITPSAQAPRDKPYKRPTGAFA